MLFKKHRGTVTERGGVVLIILYVLLGLFTLYFFYLCYKLVWYFFKIMGFRAKLKGLKKQGCRIERKRSILSMFFGKKGILDLSIEKAGQKYDVYLISFISTHGRWNIERGEKYYFAEARRYNRVFYNVYKNSSDEPGFSRDFRRESEFQKCVLHLPQREAALEEGKIILIYPIPRLLTYTENKFEYLKSGSVFHGYKILYWQEFLSFFKPSGAE